MQNTSKPILIAGCGPSIKNVPDDLWFRIPVFGINRFVVEHYITPEYWTAWDTWPLVECMPVAAKKGSKIYLNKRIKNYYVNTFKDDKYPINWWQEYSGPAGIPINEKTGLVFLTTTHAAVWKAYALGFTEIYIVGFDCTIGIQPLHDNNHFYGDGKAETYAQMWDEQMATIARHIESTGGLVQNLSIPSKAVMTPRGTVEGVLARYS